MANPFVHVELGTNDLPKARAFYGKLFDWTFEDMPMDNGTYTLIKVGEGTGGGMMTNPMPNAPSAWLAYVLPFWNSFGFGAPLGCCVAAAFASGRSPRTVSTSSGLICSPPNV